MHKDRRLHCYKAGARCARFTNMRRATVRANFIRDFYNAEERKVALQGFDDEAEKIRTTQGGVWARYGRRFGKL